MRRQVTVRQIHQRNRGFSLPETIGVLAVAGLSVSLAVPSYQFLLRSDRESTATNRLVKTLQIARSSAITRNATITVCASRGGKECDGHSWADGWLAFSSADSAADPAARTALLTEGPETGLQIESPEFARAIEFHANGGAAALDTGAISGQFLFCHAGSESVSRRVLVLPHGKTAVTGLSNPKNGAGQQPKCHPENGV
jgi:Tfp pilus assembly protein FimT